MAKFVTEYEASHKDVLVIPHFVGASATSTSLRQIGDKELPRRALGLTMEIAHQVVAGLPG